MAVVEIPSSEQLGVSNGMLIWRGFLLKCPACGQRGVIMGWFRMHDRCPTCDLLMERIEGHWIGYVGLNMLVCFTLTFFALMLGTVLMIPNIHPWELLGIAAIPGVFGPALFAPGSRTTWTAIDIAMRPLKPGEIDPRFVKVDPARDAGP